MGHRLTIFLHEEEFAICRLKPSAAIPGWASGGKFLTITRTREELSIVCEEASVPSGVQAERGRRLLQIAGPIPFTMTGVLEAMLAPLAKAEISIFAVSTYDTDYLLVKSSDLEAAVKVLESAGHAISKSNKKPGVEFEQRA